MKVTHILNELYPGNATRTQTGIFLDEVSFALLTLTLAELETSNLGHPSCFDGLYLMNLRDK